MKTIFDQLRKDHKTQRSLANTLLRTTGYDNEREQLFEQLKIELKAHANSEERYFYEPMFEHDQSQVKARHSIAEHHDIDEMIEKLNKTGLSSPAWLVNYRKLREVVFHHLDEEENEVFQVAGKVMTDSQKSSLGDGYRNMMDEQKEKLS